MELSATQRRVSRGGPDRLALRRFFAFCVVWVLVLALVQSPTFSLLWFVALTLVCVLTMLCRSLRLPEHARSATIPIAVGAALSLGAVVVRVGITLVTGTSVPFPSPADLLGISSYVILVTAVLRIVKSRSGRLNLDQLLDAGVGAVAAGLLQWSLVLLPYIRFKGFLNPAALTNLVFSALSLLLVASAVLALVAGSKPSTSNRLLAAALTALFAADSLATLSTAGKVSEELAMLFAPLALILGTAGLLHPSVKEIASPGVGSDQTRRLTRRRVSVLALALLTPPALMIWAVVRHTDEGWEVAMPALASLALTPLVVTRLGRLVRQNEELAVTEATLRSVGERLVTAETLEDVNRVISVGAQEVLGEKMVDGGLLLEPDVEEQCPPELRQSLATVRTRLEDRSGNSSTELIDLDATSDGWIITAAPVLVQEQFRAVLLLATTSPLADDERKAMTALRRESAIAIRAVDQTEQQVRQRSEERFGALIDNSSDIVAVLDRDGLLKYASPVATRLLGYEVAESFGTDPMPDLLHPDDFDAAMRMIDNVRAGHRDNVEVRLRHEDGHYPWFEVAGVNLLNDPNIGGIVLNLREISDRKDAEQQLLLSEARFKSLVLHSTDLVMVVDERQCVRYVSPSGRNVFGRDPEGLVGQPVVTVFANSGQDWSTVLPEQASDDSAAPELFEFTFQIGDEWRVIESSVTDLRSEPAVSGFVLNARDVTERKQMEQKIRYQATHDELTGLANRFLLLDDLGAMLGHNSGKTTVSAIVIGLDDFKDVNDSLGHSVGDVILVEVSERITSLLEFGDVAARVGGDQFAVAIERSHGETQISELAEQILTAVSHPFDLDGREITLTASAGVAFDHDRSAAADVMMRNADIAMYRAKSLGKRQVVVFDTTMHAASNDRLELRADLQRAITGEQFVNHYQPILDLESGRIVAAEALVRWQHPERGLLGPGLFIPLAEETGLIGLIGEWVLKKACADLAHWDHDLSIISDDFYVSVNLAVQQLTDDGLIDMVSQSLAQHGLPASRLVLEVTESTLMSDSDNIRSTMDALRALGVKLAVDDFGTGYSSLGYIQKFAFDVLKIDKSFVDGLDTFTNQRIVKAVIELAKQLEVRTVAEGIESQLQADILQDLHCGFGQGFHFARPVPEAEFREVMQKNNAQVAPPAV